MPSCTGVLAMGWQVNPQVPAPRMNQALYLLLVDRTGTGMRQTSTLPAGR